MNWITDYVRPKIRALVGKPETPEKLWEKCPACGAMLFHRDLETNLNVCSHCGHHLRMGAKKRLESLFDDGRYESLTVKPALTDPLKFRDRKRYTDRLREAQTKTGENDAIQVGFGQIAETPVVIAAFDFAFMGGSMGIAVGEAIVSAGAKALAEQAALIVIPASGGARMQEGILSLMQMPRTTIAVEQVKEAGLPYLVLLSDPTTGGVSASFAMLGDLHIAEPGAVIGFAGARVIEETIREQLPEGFQRAEYLQEHGMVDMVVDRRALSETIGRLLRMLRKLPPLAPALPSPEAAETENVSEGNGTSEEDKENALTAEQAPDSSEEKADPTQEVPTTVPEDDPTLNGKK